MKFTGILVLAILIGGVASALALPNQNHNHMIKTILSPEANAKRYAQNFHLFDFYVETIGTVVVDAVQINSGEITINYQYQSGTEVRDVQSELSLDKDGFYKGQCTTRVKGKVKFAVHTWMMFNSDGSANGNWSWSENPTKQDPVVTISLKK